MTSCQAIRELRPLRVVISTTPDPRGGRRRVAAARARARVRKSESTPCPIPKTGVLRRAAAEPTRIDLSVKPARLRGRTQLQAPERTGAGRCSPADSSAARAPNPAPVDRPCSGDASGS